MAWQLENLLFSLFGGEAKRNDNYKDADGRGIDERFMRTLGKDFDEEVMPLIDGLIDNTLVPEAVLQKFIPYLESMLGDVVQVKDDIGYRRKVIRFSTRINQVKGTRRSFEILLKLLGFATVEVEEHFGAYGFDSSVTLDNSIRRFDSGCPPCTDYTLKLTGTLALSQSVLDAIARIVSFCEPINARLRQVLVNGTPVSLRVITFFIDAGGNLHYDNTLAPDMTVELTSSGDLLIFGPDAHRYSIDSSGNIVFT